SVAPVAATAARLRPRGIVVHTDAAQATAWMPIDVRALGVDLLSLSAHKLGGPAGVGALWVRSGVRLAPQLTGGPQERGCRAGTENVAGIVGFAAAVRAARQEREEAARSAGALIGRLWDGIRARIPGAVRHGPAAGERLPNTLNVGF